MRALSLILATATLLGPAGLARAETRNPIFGKAIARATTASENKAVIGKGYYADYYGYYGNYYNSYAGQLGIDAYTYKDYQYYNYAAYYASYAANLYSYAASAEYNGQ